MPSKVLEIILRGSDQGGTATFTKLNRTLQRLKTEIPGVQKALKGLGKGLRTVFFDIPNRVFSTFIDLAKKSAAAVAGISVALGATSVGAFTQLEDSVGRLKTLSGFAETSTRDLGDAILEVSRDSGRGLEEVAATAFDIASALAEDEKAIEVLDKVMKTAVGTFGDAKPIAEGLVTSMNAYGAAAERTTEFLNVLLAAQDKGKTDFSQLAGAMGTVAAQSANMGISFAKTAGLVAGLSRSTATVSEAATQLSAVIAAVQRNTDELAELVDLSLLRTDPVKFLVELDRAAKQAGKSVIDLLGRKEAASAVAAAVENTQALVEAVRSAEQPVQTFEQLFERAAGTISVKFGQLKGELRSAFTVIGSELAPSVKRGLDGMRELLDDNRDAIGDLGFVIGRTVEESVDLFEELGRSLRGSDLLKGDIGANFEKSIVGGIRLAVVAVGKVTPAIARAYFETGALAARAFVQGAEDFLTDPEPIEDAIARTQRTIQQNQNLFASGALIGADPAIAERVVAAQDAARDRLERLITLRDEFSQQDTRLEGSLESLQAAQRSYNAVLSAAGDAVGGLAVEFQALARESVGSEKFDEMTRAVDGFKQAVTETIPEQLELRRATRDLAEAQPWLADGVQQVAEWVGVLPAKFAEATAAAVSYVSGVKQASDVSANLQPPPSGGGDGGEDRFSKLNADQKELRDIYATAQTEYLSVSDNIRRAQLELREESRETWNAMAADIQGVAVDHLVDGLAALAAGTKSTKEAFSDMAAGILSDLAKIIVRQLILNAISSLYGNGGVFTSSGEVTAAANGMAFGRGGQVVPFASGGVVTQPTFFGFGRGKLGVMGEAGPEAILPLKPGRGGKLGVSAEGMMGSGGDTFAISIHANDAQSFMQQLAQPKSRDFLLSFFQQARTERAGFAGR